MLRRTQPDLPRCFKVPGYPVTPVLADRRVHLDHPGPSRRHDLRLRDLGRGRRSLWYFFYGFKHSHLGRHEHVGLIHDP